VDNVAFYDIPAAAGGGAGKFRAVTLSGGNVVISWDGAGTLEEANAITGPWTKFSNQANPQNAPLTGAAAKFYRLQN
jgi:hypothetical protein